jgi:hypothetical protein
MKYMLEFDDDNSGTLDFGEFKVAIREARRRLRAREDCPNCPAPCYLNH